ncbi:hypothetical protein AB0M92_18960 [Streptomyces sp. NPDC051582]|uniref:hypothetical protein n=1 Tax=Streptomyces sp. NPDC051582 TaxID=3155167 RepID=UPI00342D398D
MSKLGKKLSNAADTVAATVVYAGLKVGGERGMKAANKVVGELLHRELDEEAWRNDPRGQR